MMKSESPKMKAISYIKCTIKDFYRKISRLAKLSQIKKLLINFSCREVDEG